MISFLLTLLKIIGIVLLSLLGLLFILLLIVLFVPVRYRIRGYFKEEFVSHGKITWLLHFVSVSINYDKEAVTAIKIMGIDISPLLNKKKESTSPKNDNVASKKVTSNQTSSDSTDEDAVYKQPDFESTVNKSVTSTQETIPEETVVEKNTQSKGSRSIIDKIKTFFIKIKEKILSVFRKIKEIIHNIKTKKDSLERYIAILRREEVKNSFSLCKDRIFKMIKHILPKNMKIHAHIGMEDPSITGYILATYSVLPDRIRRQIILKADFEEVIIEGDFNIKGSCYAYKFLYHIISIIINKDCRSFYTLVKKEISNERQ